MGRISMRNEEGTQWLVVDPDYPTMPYWSHNDEADDFPYSVYLEIEATVPEAQKYDCPDSGYTGIYNLTWHEV